MQAPKKAGTVRDSLRAKAKFAIEPAPAPSLDENAIADGRKPIPGRRKDTSALQARAAELYGLTDSGIAAPTAIDANFKFVPADSAAEFHYLHAELLLDRASELLNACLALRTERDALQLKQWKLQLELDEFFRSAPVQDRERAAGLDTLPYERAAREAAAENSLEQHTKNAESQLSGLAEDLLASGLNNRMAARELSAWISAYPLKDTDLHGDDAIYVFDGVRRSKPDHLFESARLEADEAAWEQVYLLMSRRFTAMAQSDAARLRKDSLNLQAKWALAGIQSRSERAAIARDLVWETVFHAQDSGSILNYPRQIALLDRRFAAGFQEALALLMAARTGLKELYGYALPFPEEAGPGYLDEVVGWNCQARNRMAQFTSLDQHYVLALSLKDLADARWQSGLATSEWTFDLTPGLFPDQTHVRLRGIAMAVVTDTSDQSQRASGGKKPAPRQGGFWSARVSIPATGSIQTLGGVTRELDQKSIPLCHLGRVADREDSREPEIIGANVLHNASPIGKAWRITLSPKSTGGTATGTLQDVELYLHLAVRGTGA